MKDAWNATERGFISVIQIFRAPAQVVDSLACKTLDTVEQVVPALTKRQEEVCLTFPLRFKVNFLKA